MHEQTQWHLQHGLMFKQALQLPVLLQHIATEAFGQTKWQSGGLALSACCHFAGLVSPILWLCKSPAL